MTVRRLVVPMHQREQDGMSKNMKTRATNRSPQWPLTAKHTHTTVMTPGLTSGYNKNTPATTHPSPVWKAFVGPLE